MYRYSTSHLVRSQVNELTTQGLRVKLLISNLWQLKASPELQFFFTSILDKCKLWQWLM